MIFQSIAFLIFFNSLRIYRTLSNCMIPNDEGLICIECDPGYYPQAGECQEIVGCNISDGRSNICQQCQNQYYLNNYCIHIENCETTDLLSPSCLKCNSGYYFNSLQKKCVQEQNCVHYDDAKLCKECISPYFLDVQGYCTLTQPLYLNCQLFDEVNNICNYCSPSYNYINDQCVQDINGCLNPFYLSENKECKYCLHGSCNDLINCQISDIKKNECLQCKSGYSLDLNLKCTIEISFCINYSLINGENKCIKCQIGYYLNYIENRCKVNPINCKEAELVNSVMRCISCKKGYYLNSLNQCQLIDYNNCSNKNTQQCLKCIQPYIPDEQDSFACKKKLDCLEVLNDKCVICSNYGKYLEPNGSCNTIDNCLYNEQNKNQCIQCSFDGFIIDTNGGCKKIINCLVSDGQNKCLKCFPMHYLNNGACQIDQYCRVTDGIQCILCEKGYFISDSNPSCQVSLTLNSLHQKVANECLICEQKYELIEKQCLEKCKLEQFRNSNGICQDKVKCLDPNCIKCDGDFNKCEWCNNSYFLQDSKCQQSCNIGFYVENAICYPCPRGCIECTDSKSCNKCSQGWYRQKK